MLNGGIVNCVVSAMEQVLKCNAGFWATVEVLLK